MQNTNPNFLSRDKTQALIDGLKVKQADGQAFLQGLADKGYVIEGFNDQPKPVEKSLVSNLKQRGTDLVNAVTNVGSQVANAKSLPQVGGAIGTGLLRVGGAVAGAVNDTVGSTASTVATTADNALGNIPSNAIKAGGQAFLATETGKKALAKLQEGKASYEAFKQANPEAAKDLENVIDIASVIPIFKGAGVAADVVGTSAKNALKEGGQLLKSTVNTISKTDNPITSTFDSERIMQNVGRIPKAQQAKFEQMAGESVGSFLDKRGIYGSEDQILTKLYNNFAESKNNADIALQQLKGTFQPEGVKTALKDLVGKFERVSSDGAVDPELPKAKALLSKMEKDGLTMTEINDVKRLYERNVKLDFLKENSPEGIKKANNIDSAIREWQFAKAKELGLQNLPEINKETMLNKQLLDALGKELAGSAGNNPISLTDWVVLSGGDPTAIGGYITKKVLSSKKVQSKIAEKLSKNKIKKTVPKPEFK